MKHKTGIFVAILLGAVSLTAAPQKKPDSLGLYRVKVKGKYGFIDRSGKPAISPQFDWAWHFWEGLGRVKVGTKYGFIDPSGHFVIKPQFDGALDFSEGLAAVQIGEKWGYIDKSGKLTIKPAFDDAGDFSDGLAPFSEVGRCGCIDQSGKTVFTFKDICSIQTFSEGLAVVKLFGTPNRSFYVDRTGKKAFQAEFEFGGDFSEGLATVQTAQTAGYIDKTGTVVVPLKTGNPSGRFSEGLAVVSHGQDGTDVENMYEYIDKTGARAIPEKFVGADPFSEGLAAVAVEVGEDVTTTTKTKTQTRIEFRRGIKYGYIDKTGALVIPAQFDTAEEFFDGLAPVCFESTKKLPVGLPDEEKRPCGYIDKTGKIIWKPSF